MLIGFLLQAQTVVNDLSGSVSELPGQADELRFSIFFDLALKGGWIMAILAVFSIIAVYIFTERYLVITRASGKDKHFMNNIREFIHAGKLDAAVALCRNNQSPIARMIEKRSVAYRQATK